MMIPREEITRFGCPSESKIESRESDSNRRPTHYECVALPAELSRQVIFNKQVMTILPSNYFRVVTR